MIGVAVIGAGPMGRLHARTVAAHPDCRLLEVVDVHPERARALGREHGAAFSGDALTSDAELVIVATPTRSHVDVALPWLADRWVLVEKPLAPTSADADALVHPRCLVGHSERFHPLLRDRPAPHRVEILREAPWTGRGTDLDVIADLLVHDLDLVRRWAGGDVELEEASGEVERGPGLDVVRVTLGWAGGHAHLQASRVADRRWRRAHLDGDVLDLLAPTEPPDALTAQLTAVVRHLCTGAGATTSADALRTLALADAVRAAIGPADPERS